MAIAIYEIKIPSSDTIRVFVDFPDEFTSIGLQKVTDAIEEEIKEYYGDNAVVNKYIQDFVVLYDGAVDTKLKERTQSLIDEIACDFYKHEPFIDPIARKHVHETLDKMQQEVEEISQQINKQLVAKQDLAKAQEVLSKVQQLDKEIKSLFEEIDERLKKLLAQNSDGAQGGKDVDSKVL